MNKIEPIKIENSGKYEIKHYRNGSRVWYKDGLIHREDGPAMIYASPDTEFYFLYGILLDLEEWELICEKMYFRDQNMVYTLKFAGIYQKGKPIMENDKYFSIQGGTNYENEELAEKIRNMLNKEIVKRISGRE